MAFNWTHDLSHIVTNFYFQSYSVGGTTTVDDLMQVYLMKTADRTVKGHCFRTAFTTLTNKSVPANSWAVGLASPGVIFMVHRARETSTDNTGQLEVNLYRVAEVVNEGGAYSAGATDMTDVIAHDPYLSVAIPQVAGYTTTAKKFEVVAWKADTLLIVDTVDAVQTQWRVHEVSLIDGTVTTHSSMFGSGTDFITNYNCTFIMRDGRLFVNAAANSWIINTTTWVSDDTAALANATLMELSDGTFYYNDRATDIKYLYDSSLSSIGLLSNQPDLDISMCRDYSSTVLWGQGLSTISTGDVMEAVRASFSGATTTLTSFPNYTTGNETYGWGCIVDSTYWLYYNPAQREFSLVTLANGTAHPSISNWKEVDSDIPTGGNASDLGNWGAIVSGAAAPTGSTVWPRIRMCGDAITLQYGVQNGDFIATYPVNAVGIANNDGSPIPLLRASDLVVSDASASSSYMKLRDVHVPTVDNLLAGSNVTLTKSGANVTISSSGGGGGGGGVGNIYGAYDIEDATYTDLGLSEEFEGGGINTNWTVVDGTSGTVALLGTVAACIYDLATRDKGLLVQTPNVSTQSFSLRAPIIATGEQIIFSLSIPNATSATVMPTVGVAVTSASTSWNSNIVSRMYKDNGTRIRVWNSGAAITDATEIPDRALRYYFRVIRSGGYMHYLVSVDGISWSCLGAVADTSVSHIWLFIQGSVFTRINTGDPVVVVNWIRHVAYSGGFDPW